MTVVLLNDIGEEFAGDDPMSEGVDLPQADRGLGSAVHDPASRRDSGVVHDQRGCSQRFADLVGSGLDGIFVRDVTLDVQNLGRTRCSGCILWGSHVEYCDLCALLAGEDFNGRLADSGGTAGDDDHVLFPIWLVSAPFSVVAHVACEEAVDGLGEDEEDGAAGPWVGGEDEFAELSEGGRVSDGGVGLAVIKVGEGGDEEEEGGREGDLVEDAAEDVEGEWLAEGGCRVLGCCFC